MNVSAKKYKGLKVYKDYKNDIYGVVESAYFRKSDKRLFAFLIGTASIIPVHKVVLLEQISKLTGDCIYLRQSCEPLEIQRFQGDYSGDFFLAEGIDNAICNHKSLRLNDICFDMETGEITDIIVSKKRLAKKTKISINKIRIKDNNIYVE